MATQMGVGESKGSAPNVYQLESTEDSSSNDVAGEGKANGGAPMDVAESKADSNDVAGGGKFNGSPMYAAESKEDSWPNREPSSSTLRSEVDRTSIEAHRHHRVSVRATMEATASVLTVHVAHRGESLPSLFPRTRALPTC
jgi:hypothetical protein